MSRVAKVPIALPSTVTFTIEDGKVTIKGPKGCMSHDLNQLVLITKSDESTPQLTFKPASNDPMAWAQAGTARAIISNMVNGVTEGYTRTLELVGVGYRAQAKENSVSLSLGFSHPIEYLLPHGVTAETPNVTTIILKGIDKQRVGQVASEIRAFRPPEPYKGKGVKYAGEVIVRKEAKKK
jgi:large subunit ribosomal protein L6